MSGVILGPTHLFEFREDMANHMLSYRPLGYVFLFIHISMRTRLIKTVMGNHVTQFLSDVYR